MPRAPKSTPVPAWLRFLEYETNAKALFKRGWTARQVVQFLGNPPRVRTIKNGR